MTSYAFPPVNGGASPILPPSPHTTRGGVISARMLVEGTLSAPPTTDQRKFSTNTFVLLDTLQRNQQYNKEKAAEIEMIQREVGENEEVLEGTVPHHFEEVHRDTMDVFRSLLISPSLARYKKEPLPSIFHKCSVPKRFPHKVNYGILLKEQAMERTRMEDSHHKYLQKVVACEVEREQLAHRWSIMLNEPMKDFASVPLTSSELLFPSSPSSLEREDVMLTKPKAQPDRGSVTASDLDSFAFVHTPEESSAKPLPPSPLPRRGQSATSHRLSLVKNDLTLIEDPPQVLSSSNPDSTSLRPSTAKPFSTQEPKPVPSVEACSNPTDTPTVSTSHSNKSGLESPSQGTSITPSPSYPPLKKSTDLPVKGSTQEFSPSVVSSSAVFPQPFPQRGTVSLTNSSPTLPHPPSPGRATLPKASPGSSQRAPVTSEAMEQGERERSSPEDRKRSSPKKDRPNRTNKTTEDIRSEDYLPSSVSVSPFSGGSTFLYPTSPPEAQALVQECCKELRISSTKYTQKLTANLFYTLPDLREITMQEWSVMGFPLKLTKTIRKRLR